MACPARPVAWQARLCGGLLCPLGGIAGSHSETTCCIGSANAASHMINRAARRVGHIRHLDGRGRCGRAWPVSCPTRLPFSRVRMSPHQGAYSRKMVLSTAVPLVAVSSWGGWGAPALACPEPAGTAHGSARAVARLGQFKIRRPREQSVSSSYTTTACGSRLATSATTACASRPASAAAVVLRAAASTTARNKHATKWHPCHATSWHIIQIQMQAGRRLTPYAKLRGPAKPRPARAARGAHPAGHTWRWCT